MISVALISVYCLQIGGCSGLPTALPGVQIGEPDASYANSDTDQLRLKVLHVAKEMLGLPYHYGGATPEGFDCSGLVFYSYSKIGVKVPRTTLEQYRQTKAVSAQELMPGDLVFFRLNGRDISHVGIYQGDHKFIHAPVSGKQISSDSLHNRFWRERFVRGGRFI
ncbi:MAG TPA: C40 family peptidase [Gammaproteobacteria bacterium]|nr:C40 family peptidase [Gammaproteobacteria bacterium]